MSVVYGPVPSWRLGNSLGIDPILPPKRCTYDCIYCQLGPTKEKITTLEKVEVTPSIVRAHLRRKLRTLDLDDIDYITLSGSGEPTLNPLLGEIILVIREETKGRVPIAILTNASLLWRPEVRKALRKVDLVVAKVDAVDEDLYIKINRPHAALSLGVVLKGIELFRREFQGKLAAQVMLLKKDNLKNITPRHIAKLRKVLSSIQFDEIQLNTPLRPPADPKVLPLSHHEINQIAKELASLGIPILTPFTPRAIRKVHELSDTIEEEILDLLRRRPSDVDSLARILPFSEEEIKRALNVLMAKRLVDRITYRGRVFYKACEVSSDASPK